MANEEHLKILRQGVEAWNRWREENPDIRPDLSEACLVAANLCEANLRRANLRKAILREVKLSKADLTQAHLNFADLIDANLSEAILVGADLSFTDLRWASLPKANLSEANLTSSDLTLVHLSEANLHKATLHQVDLFQADLRGANLSEADLLSANLREAVLINSDLRRANLDQANLYCAKLSGAFLAAADLSWTDLSGADLSGASLIATTLTNARLVETNLEKANLTHCRVYGISAWELKLGGAIQSNLIITRHGEPTITVDNLEVAQFIYLLLNNEKIRQVIDTITTKIVLILGRFTPERKTVLDAIRDELRKRNYLPVLFDFEKPASRDLTKTVRILAHLARFIIADITEPSILQELQAIVPDLAVPVQPLLLEGSTGEYGMFQDFPKKYHWVLKVHRYRDLDDLLASLGEKVIVPAEAKVKELAKR